MASTRRGASPMDGPKERHSVSLKVLRLSRPSLSQQHPLTKSSDSSINIKTASSLPSSNADDRFTFAPLLTLPPAFGFAYVGESFSCTLSANNELSEKSDQVVTSVKITAEMQTPSQSIPLQLVPENDEAVKSGMASGSSLQKIVRFDLSEEGNHVLAVNLSYSETTISKAENTASSGRVRSFRKLYQFIAQPCLSVRTKASDLPSGTAGEEKSPKSKLSRYSLEAHLENMADGLITLESANFEAKLPFKSTSLNWDIPHPQSKHTDLPVLAPREVTQVAFLVEEHRSDNDGVDAPRKEFTKDGRTILGQLSVQWRSAMGDPGMLSTGWLTSRRF